MSSTLDGDMQQILQYNSLLHRIQMYKMTTTHAPPLCGILVVNI